MYCSQGAPAVVEGHDLLRRARQVGHDEANPRIKLAGVPLDLGHHPVDIVLGSEEV